MPAFLARARPLVAVGAAAAMAGHRYGPVRNEQKAFVPLKCIGTEQHTHNTRKVTFATQEPLPAQSIVNFQVRAKLGGTSADGNVTRMYNPLSVQAGDRITLLVKKYEGSLMGTHIHDLQVGDTLEAKGPNTQKKVEFSKYSDYAFIAGGTGITPLVQAAEQVLRNDLAKVTFITLNKSEKDRLLVKELEELGKSYPVRLNVRHIVEKDGALLPTPGEFASLLPPPNSNVMVMVCGRGEMTAAIAGPKTKDFKQGDLEGVLKELGYTSLQVWKV